MQKREKKSVKIADFLNFLTECEREYKLAYEQVGIEDKIHQDIIHKFELENLTKSEKGKLATKLVENRRTRRYFKDLTEELEPMVNYLANNKKAFDVLRQTLGEVRKVENYHADRTYKPRVNMEQLLKVKG